MPQKNLLIIIIAIILTAILVGGAVYFWQSSTFAKEKQQLQQMIQGLNNQITQLQNQLKDDGNKAKCSFDSNSLLFDPVEFGDYQAYAKTQDNKNYVILCKAGQEIIVDQGDAEYNNPPTNLNEVKEYNSLKFSPKGNFLIFTAARWEWQSYHVYSFEKEKLVFQSDSFVNELVFVDNDKYAYYCGPEDRSADDTGLIFITDNFGIEHSSNYTGADFDIHSLYEKGSLLNVSCRYEQVNNSVIFDVLEFKGLLIDPSTRQFHEYSLDERKIIKQ